MASYSLFAADLLRSVVTALGAQRPQPGAFLRHGYPAPEVVSLLILAPITYPRVLKPRPQRRG